VFALFCAPCIAADRDADVEQLASHSYAELVIPEPMVFDLVRPLGARKGELEVNALALFPIDGNDPTPWGIAPEIEFAVIDGLALEFELPFEDGELDSLKFAVQGTFGKNDRFIHGTQFIAEYALEEYAWELSLLYIPAYRFDRTWSVLSMFGVRSITGSHVRDEFGGIVNATLFADVNEHVVLGLEVDSIIAPAGQFSILLMPQVHLEFGGHWTLQAGAGVLYREGEDGPYANAGDEEPPTLVREGRGWYPQVALRLVYDF
jgi:hypothetical protein